MKKYIIVIAIIVVGIIALLSVKQCKRTPSVITKDDGWETLKKRNQEELRRKDSVYLDLKQKTDLRIRTLEREILTQEQKHQKQLSDLKLKYDKEYSKVSNTPVDGTVVISTKFLSEEIDYSKFQK